MNRISKTRIIAMLMSVAMLLTLLPVGLSAATANEWDISKSKTATNLNTDFLSQVTLSLPSAEEQLVTDVVFVLDKSTSTDTEKEANDLLEALVNQISGTGACVKVGVILFDRNDHDMLGGLVELTEDSLQTVKDAISATITYNDGSKAGGTNTHAGLVAGKKLLDSDTSVSNDRKYLIFVSDAITYIFDDENGTATSIVSESYEYRLDSIIGTRNLAYTGAAFKYSYKTNIFSSETVADYLLKIGTLIQNDANKYWVPYESNPNDAQFVLKSKYNDNGKQNLTDEDYENFVGLDDSVNDHANNLDTALYLTYAAFNECVEKYNCYVLRATTKNYEESDYPWAPTYMSYLAQISGNENVGFDGIQNDILYLVDAGSYVDDYIGYVEGDYDFDFVNDAAELFMTVGGIKYPAVETGYNNTYGFKQNATGGNDYIGYDYILTYYPGEGNTEHFVWTINVPVSNFAPVQLTYTVKLTNPQTEPGTYGTYDIDGSKGYKGLYTNNSAILYPVDSTSVSGTSEAFPRPTVSYNVGSISEPEPEPEPEPDEPGPIWPTFTMATVIKVDSEDENIRLSGAKFELYREGRATPIGLNVDTTDENGELRLPSLTPGSTYYLVEVAAPEGYMLTSEPIVFTAEYDMRQNVIYVTNTKSKTPSDLNSDDHFAYIVGYPDGNVRPTGNITRAEVATIFFRLLTEEVRNENMTWDNPFSDVNKGDWFDCAISTLYAMGIINGYPDGTYNPNGFITRAEFAAIAARFDTIGNDFEQSFADVYGHWAEDEIAAAKAHGWLTGYEDGSFKPDQLITRAEAMTIVNRVLNRIPESADALLDDMVKWPDNADTSAWYYLAVQEATNSHFYDRTDSNKEIWTEIREPRDWTELEK